MGIIKEKKKNQKGYPLFCIFLTIYLEFRVFNLSV